MRRPGFGCPLALGLVLAWAVGRARRWPPRSTTPAQARSGTSARPRHWSVSTPKAWPRR